MGNTLSVTDDYYFLGKVRLKNAPALPNNSIPASAIAGPIDASALERLFNLAHSQTGTIAAATQYLRMVAGATAQVLAVKAAITEAIATGADRTVTIDVLKSTGGGAFASILGAAIVFDHTATLRAVSTAAISTADCVDRDVLCITVAVAGSASAQATGLAVNVDLSEDPV